MTDPPPNIWLVCRDGQWERRTLTATRTTGQDVDVWVGVPITREQARADVVRGVRQYDAMIRAATPGSPRVTAWKATRAHLLEILARLDSREQDQPGNSHDDATRPEERQHDA